MLNQTYIVLNVGRAIRHLRQVLKVTGPLSENEDEIITQVIECVRDQGSSYTQLVHYVANVKHSQARTIPEPALQRLGMAVGDLGMAILQELEHHGVYDGYGYLWYDYDTLSHDAVVLKTRQSGHYMEELFRRAS